MPHATMCACASSPQSAPHHAHTAAPQIGNGDAAALAMELVLALVAVPAFGRPFDRASTAPVGAMHRSAQHPSRARKPPSDDGDKDDDNGGNEDGWRQRGHAAHASSAACNAESTWRATASSSDAVNAAATGGDADFEREEVDAEEVAGEGREATGFSATDKVASASDAPAEDPIHADKP